MITAVARDFRVETYSVVSLTEISLAVSTFTGMPGGPCACAPRVEPLPQAKPNAANPKVAARPDRHRDWADGHRPLSASKSIWSTPCDMRAWRAVWSAQPRLRRTIHWQSKQYGCQG